MFKQKRVKVIKLWLHFSSCFVFLHRLEKFSAKKIELSKKAKGKKSTFTVWILEHNSCSLLQDFSFGVLWKWRLHAMFCHQIRFLLLFSPIDDILRANDTWQYSVLDLRYPKEKTNKFSLTEYELMVTMIMMMMTVGMVMIMMMLTVMLAYSKLKTQLKKLNY